MASTLTDGSPCPVCGSTKHPCLAGKSVAAPTEEEVNEAKDAYERAQEKANKASVAASTQKGIVTNAEEKLLREAGRLLPGVPLQEVYAAAQDAYEALEEEFSAIEKQITQVESREARAVELQTLIPQKEEELLKAYTTETEAKEKIASLTTAVAELNKQIVEKKRKLVFADKAEAEIQKDALQEKLDALKKVLTDAENNYNTCKEELAGIRSAIEQLTTQLAESCEIDVGAFEEEKQALLSQKKEITDQKQDVHTRIITNGKAQTDISAKAEEMAQLEERHAWVRALSDTANGTLSGKDKIMLETYIQTTYFDRILQRANLRLLKMSGGQYDLKRRRKAESMRGQSGLELDIIDHVNGTERSVNTLSGGEAFLASLALALGLSDEVQMSTGIKLDTLFVDEGFGSLDSEALSKAYNTLASLTEGNRLVGIISHVAELKEKIDAQRH